MATPKNGMRPVHPGEILREDFLLPLGMSANALATALRVPAPRINDIVRERRAVTPDTALRLARYFGGDAQSWMNLQLAFDLRTTEIANGPASPTKCCRTRREACGPGRGSRRAELARLGLFAKASGSPRRTDASTSPRSTGNRAPQRIRSNSESRCICMKLSCAASSAAFSRLKRVIAST